jgi:molybdopterin-guanine dinucleotide biosynthesis protein A
VLRDLESDLGPLPAVALGLGAIRTTHAFALGCDAPFVRRAMLRLLTRAVGDLNAAIPRWDDRLQPLVALYHARLAPTLTALAAAGERRLHVIASLPGVRTVPSELCAAVDPQGISFRTLNTPDEYAAACAAREVFDD